MHGRKLAWVYAGVLISTLVCAGGAEAQKIKVEYNKQTDFSQYKTYSWMKLGSYDHPFIVLDMIGAIDDALQAKGLKKLTGSGDLLVTGYGSFDTDLNVSYDVDVYAMPSLDGPIWWQDDAPLVGGGSVSVEVAKGTMVIDLVDRKAKKLKWRGIAKANVDPDQQEKTMETLEKAISKMFDEFPGNTKK